MKYPTTLEDRINTEYWLDREGKAHKYIPKQDETHPHDVCYLHSRIATTIFPNAHNARDELIKLGWIAVGVLGGTQNPICEIEPTQAQINALFDEGYVKMNKAYGVGAKGWGEVYYFTRINI